MTKKRMLALGGAVALVLLVAGSGLGAYVYAQDGDEGVVLEDGATTPPEAGEFGAIACDDSVFCSRTGWVMRVVNTGSGGGIYGRTNSTAFGKTAVGGYATNNACGVYGRSVNGYGVYGRTDSSNVNMAGVYGYSAGNAAGVYGKHSTSGNHGYLGSSNYGVFGYSSSGSAVIGESSSGAGVNGHSDTLYGVFGTTFTGSAVHGYSSSSGDGVFGYSSSGNGVHGQSSSGYAGYFEGAVFVDETIHFDPIPQPSTPATGCLIYCDSVDGDLYVKFSNGTVKCLAFD